MLHSVAERGQSIHSQKQESAELAVCDAIQELF